MSTILVYTSDPNRVNTLTSALRRAGGFDLLPACANLAELEQTMADRAPDLALLDLSSDLTFEALSRFRRNSRTRLVLWIGSISQELAFYAMEMGVQGILRKSLPMDLHVKCLQSVQAGGAWFEKALVENVLAPVPVALTPAELHLVSLLAQGLKNREIAGELAISETQVATALTRVFRKIGVKDRFELALYALKHLPVTTRANAAGAAVAAAEDLEAIA